MYIYIYICVCVCVCTCIHIIYIYIYVQSREAQQPSELAGAWPAFWRRFRLQALLAHLFLRLGALFGAAVAYGNQVETTHFKGVPWILFGKPI